MSEDPNKYKADEKCYRYFARLETWHREEAAALLLKLDPRIALAPDSITHMRPVDYWPQYRDLLEMITRAKIALPDNRPLRPGLIISWSRTVGLNPPQELVAAIEATDSTEISDSTDFSEMGNTTDIQPPPRAAGVQENAPLHHKTKASLLKLVAGMAIRGYAYNPTQRQNAAISEIESDLRLLNIPLSDDTIRRWIAEACELIDWETVDEDAKPRKS